MNPQERTRKNIGVLEDSHSGGVVSSRYALRCKSECPAMEKEQLTKIERCIRTGVRAGCPREQVEGLVSSGYFPLPWQWRFHAAAREADHPDGPVDIGTGGARGPGKSHGVLSQAALDDCQREPFLKVLFLRQTGSAAKESFTDLIDKVVVGHVPVERTAVSVKFRNGSKIIFGGFKDERDIDKYIGIEYDIIIVEELNQLTEEKYMKLRGSLRTSKPKWRPRMYTSFNPGGRGHNFVKSRYVLPMRQGMEKQTRFIGSTYKDNPHTNKEYRDYLEGITGTLGQAWREGNWDIFEGQYFSEWRYDLHVCEPFEIPSSWKRFRSLDPSGREGITSCHWYALDSDGGVVVYKEYYYGPGVINQNTGEAYGVGRDYDQHAIAVAAKSKDSDGEVEPYVYTVIDTAAFSKQGYSETAAEIYERHEVTGLIPAAKERVVGWNAVHYYLRHDEVHKPKIRIFKTCVNLIRTIPLLQHDELHPEDVDSTGEDHAADELRYFLRTLREQKSPKKLTEVERRLKEMHDQENLLELNYSRS